MDYKEDRFSVTRGTTLKAQRLRRELTPAERKLWARLKGRQIEGLQFRRQHPIGPFIVDFYCAAFKLAVELDGDSHGVDGAAQRDERRTHYIRSKGVDVLRFWNSAVHENIDGVIADIMLEIHRLRFARSGATSTHGFPPLKREG